MNRTLHAVIDTTIDTNGLKSDLVMPALVMTSLWMYVGCYDLFSRVQSVDRKLKEVAQVDGADDAQLTWLYQANR